MLTATLTRSFPDRLIVTLTERTPVARVMADVDGEPRALLVAKDGVMFAGEGHDPIAVAALPLIEGAALTVLVVFLFLNSWRSTVITGLALPVSVISAFIAVWAFGFTLNTMSLLGLSLAIGILIDDAIVVRENIMRHIGFGKSHRQAAIDGTNEIGLAVLATTFCIVAVFLPVAFMGGIIGRFFFQFGVMVTAAVLISLFVSFTLDPMLSSVWYDPQAHGNGRFARIVNEPHFHRIEKFLHSGTVAIGGVTDADTRRWLLPGKPRFWLPGRGWATIPGRVTSSALPRQSPPLFRRGCKRFSACPAWAPTPLPPSPASATVSRTRRWMAMSFAL